jgi:hypothetical protein
MNKLEQPGKKLLTLYRTQDKSEKIITFVLVLIFTIFNFIVSSHNEECLIKKISSSELNLQTYLIVDAICGILGLVTIVFHFDYSYSYQNQVATVLSYLNICWEYLNSIYFFILMHQSINCSYNTKVYLYIYCCYQLLNGFVVLLFPYVEITFNN